MIERKRASWGSDKGEGNRMSVIKNKIQIPDAHGVRGTPKWGKRGEEEIFDFKKRYWATVRPNLTSKMISYFLIARTTYKT